MNIKLVVFVYIYSCFIIGGYIKSGTPTDYILSFDIRKETWSQVGSLKQARDYHSMSVVNAEDVVNYCKDKGKIDDN